MKSLKTYILESPISVESELEKFSSEHAGNVYIINTKNKNRKIEVEILLNKLPAETTLEFRGTAYLRDSKAILGSNGKWVSVNNVFIDDDGRISSELRWADSVIITLPEK